MRVNVALMKSTAVNLSLLLVAGAVGLVLCEVSLRLCYPKYRHVASAQFHADAMRIWAHTPNARDWMTHPDSFVTHSLHHNNLALRQHRDFSAADLAAATNIGVFGDSFTENIRMPVQYSFTEPLDYLLNQSGERFNVLNFGVDGYGTDQSLLYYEHFRHADDLAHVFYVYFGNDLLDISQTGLFHLDETRGLVRNETIRASWWPHLLSRLHISYLVLDVRQRWSFLMAETAGTTAYLKRGIEERVRDERYGALPRYLRTRLGPVLTDQKDTLEIFRQLIRSWKYRAEHNGSTFSVVFVPHRSSPVLVDLLEAEGVESIYLDACFGNHDPAHHDRAWRDSPYRFRNDSHWNETGNQLAAICLYRFLEENMGLPRLSEDELWEVLSRYYAAFAGGMPLKTGGGKGAVSLEAAAEIREKYLALDMSNALKDVQDDLIQLATQPNRRIIASNFDVYLYRNEIFYVKADCRRGDMEAPFFLHMIPVDERALRGHHHKRGFDRRGFEFAKWGIRIGRHDCATKMPLPYPVRYIRTGQYVRDEGILWEGESWIGPHGGEEERPKFPAAAGKRIIQSDFDVYLDGRGLVYHKAECGPADREAPFFLQVTPTDATVLPLDRRQVGFDSLDENSCRIEKSLPVYAIRHIRTGQFVPGKKDPLWKVEFSLNHASGSGGPKALPAPQGIVRSVFDVTLDERRLIYHKAACRPADTEALFFVHVTPVDETDLPPWRVQERFDNLDFRFRPSFSVNEFGCKRRQTLPPYAIRHIRTGQYSPGKGVLWEGEFAMAQDVLEQD